MAPTDDPGFVGRLPRRLPVSLVVTVYNEGPEIGLLLRSLALQTAWPVEAIIVDGGSTDGTAEQISDFIRAGHGWVRLIVDPTCSSRCSDSPIARGRNVAIEATRSAVIAVTDASTELSRDWLEKITAPILRGTADYAGTLYAVAECASPWGRFFAFLHTPLAADATATFIPSSRSIAFLRTFWRDVRGYPGGDKYGEDTEFVLRLQTLGARGCIIPERLAVWHPSQAQKWSGGTSLVFKYARGDGRRGILAFRYAKLLVYYAAIAGTAICAAMARPPAQLVFLWAFTALCGGIVLRAWRIFQIRGSRGEVAFGLPFVFYLTSLDVARLLGYLGGRAAGWVNR